MKQSRFTERQREERRGGGGGDQGGCIQHSDAPQHLRPDWCDRPERERERSRERSWAAAWAYLSDDSPRYHLTQPLFHPPPPPRIGVAGRDEAPSEETSDVRSYK